MKDERKRILADIVARDDVYYSASAGFDNMHIHARSTADDGVAGGAFENALERLLANSETNIEKVMDGEQ